MLIRPSLTSKNWKCIHLFYVSVWCLCIYNKISTPCIYKQYYTYVDRSETPALFQVLAEKRLDRVGGAMMASTHIYDMASVAVGGGGPKRGQDTVELALDPSELDLVDTEAMAARYEQQIREQQSQLQKEDLSDMLAEHVARQKVSWYFICVKYCVCFCMSFK